jgi:hypothetical protein
VKYFVLNGKLIDLYTHKMNYKCNKCHKEFRQRKELVVHKKRKTPCGIKDNFDIVMQEVDKILDKLEKLDIVEDQEERDETVKKITKQIDQLQKMYVNLNDLEQIKLSDILKDEVKPLLEEQSIKIPK